MIQGAHQKQDALSSEEQSGQVHFSSPNPSLMKGLDTLRAEHNCEAIFYLLCECAYYFLFYRKDTFTL